MLKPMSAAVIRAADRWRGIPIGEFEQRQFRAIRNELSRDQRLCCCTAFNNWVLTT
jgi:hypothetical protein